MIWKISSSFYSSEREILEDFETNSLSNFVIIKNGQLHYRSYKLNNKGEQPIGIYLHGFKHNLHSFANLIPRFDAPAIAIDFRGHGDSIIHDQSYFLITDYLYDLNKIIAQLPSKRFILIGHSLGGRVAMMWAALYPKTVAALILIDSYYRIYDSEHFLGKLRQWIEQVDLEPLSYPRITRDYLRDYFKKQAPRMSDSLADYLAKHSYHTLPSGELVPHWNQEHQRPSPMYIDADSMNRIIGWLKCPVLALQASTNFKSLPEFGVEKDNIQIQYIEGGHMLHWEQPVEVAKGITKFIFLPAGDSR